MSYVLINGSPKINKSNSSYFLNILNEQLKDSTIFSLKTNKHEEILTNIVKNETIVLAFPLYIDSPTSITLEFLDYIFDKKINLENKNLYAIINCGFREAKQNRTATNIIKNWCNKTKVNYKGSILIGAGEIVGKKKYQLITKKAMTQFLKFCSYVKTNDSLEDIEVTMDLLNNKSYVLLANINWNKKCHKNGLAKKDIIQK